MNIDKKLCGFCTTLISIATIGILTPHHPSVESLHKSYKEGCPLCAVISDSYFSYLDNQELLLRKPHSHVHTESCSLIYALSNPPNTTNEFRWIFQFYCRERDESSSVDTPYNLPSESVTSDSDRSSEPEGTIPRKERVWPSRYDYNSKRHLGNIGVSYCLESTHDSVSSTTTGSSQSTDHAIRWAKQCIESHTECKKNQHKGFLPSRVLDIGTADQSKLKLFLSGSEPPLVDSNYITLSHCWGGLQIKKLSTGNLARFCEYLEITELPRTFQDAIYLSRVLGVRFLWIDSLCIIQDSPSDWAAESAVMGEIYKNSLLCIAASAAPDGTYGLFVERDPLLLQQCRVTLENFPGPKSPSGLYTLMPEDIWVHNVSNMPLNERGWVLQEQFLSDRLLHCSRTQLLWECHEMAACETYPSGIPMNLLYGAYISEYKRLGLSKRMRQPRDLAIDSQASTRKKGKVLELWTELIYDYTRRSLSVESDVLIALTAVAKDIQSLLEDQYLAGLWRSNLPYDLMWVRSRDGPPGSPPTEYLAPSWSWASNKAEVFMGIFDEATHPGQYMIEILEAVVYPKADDVMAQAAAGYIKLRGWLKSLSGFDVTGKYPLIKSYNGMMMSIRGYIFLDRIVQCQNHELYCLPITETKTHNSIRDTWTTSTKGLILEKTGVEGEYRRVGRFDSMSNESFDGSIEPDPFSRPFYPPPAPGEDSAGTTDQITTSIEQIQDNLVSSLEVANLEERENALDALTGTEQAATEDIQPALTSEALDCLNSEAQQIHQNVDDEWSSYDSDTSDFGKSFGNEEEFEEVVITII